MVDTPARLDSGVTRGAHPFHCPSCNKVAGTLSILIDHIARPGTCKDFVEDYIPQQIRALLYDGIVFKIREKRGCVRVDEVQTLLLTFGDPTLKTE